VDKRIAGNTGADDLLGRGYNTEFIICSKSLSEVAVGKLK
jgi:hypothetical protein